MRPDAVVPEPSWANEREISTLRLDFLGPSSRIVSLVLLLLSINVLRTLLESRTFVESM